LDSKRQLENVPIQIEILQVKLEAANAKLATVKALEPQGMAVQKQILQNWDEVRKLLISIDSAGETLKQNFEKLQNLEKDIVNLGHEFASLTGVDPRRCYPSLTFCQRSDLPKFLDIYAEHRASLSLWIVEHPWQPWTYRPPQPE